MLNYHDIPGLNASGINAFYRSPLHFWKQSTFNENREKKEPTPAMVVGSLCHCLILEPETFDKYFVMEIKVDKRTVQGRKDWKVFKSNLDGRMPVTIDQYNQASQMRDAMFSNNSIKKLLGNGCSEEVVTWHREDNGIRCKAKLDYLRNGLVVDYKKTEDANPKTFMKSIANYGYHRQMAWYMEAAERHTGEKPRGAVLIVQEKSMPEAIGIYALDNAAIEQGEKECNHAYEEISERLKTGRWDAYINPDMPIQSISLPGWY